MTKEIILKFQKKEFPVMATAQQKEYNNQLTTQTEMQQTARMQEKLSDRQKERQVRVKSSLLTC